MEWITDSHEGAILQIKVVPRASRDEIVLQEGGPLKVRLRAVPLEGRANRALIDYLAEVLDVPRSRIRLLSGDTGRNKRVLAAGLTASEVIRSLVRMKTG